MTTSDLIAKLQELDPTGQMRVFSDMEGGLFEPRPQSYRLYQGLNYVDYEEPWTDKKCQRFTGITL